MPVDCYLSTTSASSGDTIGVFLSSPGPVKIGVTRYPDPALALGPIDVATAIQPAPDAEGWTGFGWQETTQFPVAPAWPSGLYHIVDCTSPGPPVPVGAFVVRPSGNVPTSPRLLHVSFLTPHAYMKGGGKSLYDFASDPPPLLNEPGSEHNRAPRVSLDRPGIFPGVLSPSELDFIGWAEAKGITLDYCSSLDFGTDVNLLSGYECLICVGHDEYWTCEMYDQAERFVRNGGNIVNLSGNTCWRQVRMEDNDRTVVFEKYAGNDSVPDVRHITVAFPDPPLFRPPTGLLGVGWQFGAFQDISLPPAHYQFFFTDHWVFGGTGNPAGSIDFLNYETDAAAHLTETIDGVEYPYVTGEDGTTTAFTVLGRADLRRWGGKPGYATMGLYRRGGTVFSAGTTQWITQLGDQVLGRITENVIRAFSAAQAFDWEKIGAANAPQAMAASRDRLWLVTNDGKLKRRFPVGADVPWLEVGAAPGDALGLAFAGGKLFLLEPSNQLLSRPAIETPADWTPLGAGPPGGPGPLAAAGGMLYVLHGDGTMSRAPAPLNPADLALSWSTVGSFTRPLEPVAGGEPPAVTSMCAVGDLLFATTTDDRLLRSDHDFIGESTGWVDVFHANAGVALAAVEHMLFVVTSDNVLWRLDLASARVPEWS